MRNLSLLRLGLTHLLIVVSGASFILASRRHVTMAVALDTMSIKVLPLPVGINAKVPTSVAFAFGALDWFLPGKVLFGAFLHVEECVRVSRFKIFVHLGFSGGLSTPCVSGEKPVNTTQKLKYGES
jgi:hypothetical protein